MKSFILILVAAVLLVGCGGAKETDLQLIEFSRKGDLKGVKDTISDGGNVNAKNAAGETALHTAAFNNHTNIIYLLIDYGANINAQDSNGYTSTDIARKDAAAVLRMLGGKSAKSQKQKDQDKIISVKKKNQEIKKEAHKDITFNDIQEIASGFNNPKNVSKEMKFFSEQVGIWEVRVKTGKDEDSMIEHPIVYSFVKIVRGRYLVNQLLPSNGIRLRSRVTVHNEENYYNTYFTTSEGLLNETKLTIDKKRRTFREESIKLNLDSESFTAIGSFYKNKKRSKVKYFREGKTIRLHEYELTKVGDSNFKLRTYEDKYVEKKSKNPRPKMSIWEAAGKGQIETLREHLLSGSNVNAKQGISGWTPLTIASLNGRLNAAIFLLLNDADINSIGLRTTALSEAGGNYMMNKLLLANGADTEIKIGGARNTVLHKASLMGRIKIVDLLINSGANVNSRDYLGQTPLDKALGKAASLLRKHGGKTGEELEAAGN